MTTGTATRRRFAVGLGAMAAASLAAPAHAGPPDSLRATVSVDRGSAVVGDQIVVKLEVENDSGSAPSPELPPSVRDSFEVGQCVPGVSTEVDMLRGRRVQTRSLRCVIAAKKAGTHEIGFSVKAGRKTVRSNTVRLEIVEPGAETETTDATNEPTQPAGDIFLWATVDKTQAYVGEQIVYALDIYEARRFLDPHLRSPPTFQDFFSQELPVPEPRLTEVGGVTYRVHPGLRRALFPQRAGTASIGAAEIAVGLRRREVSQPITIEVLPLPAEGQPPNFSANNVGDYEISASVDRQKVRQGEPLTLTVTIEGTGNIDVVDPGPWPQIEGVRRYDPQIETERVVGEQIGGTRTFEFLLIPQHGGTITIPRHELHFFDPSQAAYRTVRTEPIELQVEGEAPSEGATEAPGDAQPQGELLQSVITSDSVPRHPPRERWLSQRRWIYAMVAVPVISALSVSAELLWRRFGPDERARARALAKARRRERIEEAQQGLQSGEGFHVALSRLLHELAVDRAGPEGVGLPRPHLMRLLERRGVARQDLRKLEDLLEQCDAARYAGQRGTAEERRVLLDDALTLVRRSSLSEGTS